jgi:hypothetical protein
LLRRRDVAGGLDEGAGLAVAPVRLIGRTCPSRGKQSVETIGPITGLAPERADAAALLQIARGPGEIENQLHRVRGMSSGEDACRVLTNAAPQVLAALRDAGLGLLRAWEVGNFAAAVRRHAAKPLKAIQMVLQLVPT